MIVIILNIVTEMIRIASTECDRATPLYAVLFRFISVCGKTMSTYMGNLVIVSNRLPVSVKRVDGKLEFYPSIGGLATGLSSYASKGKGKWIGWPGIPSDDLSDAEKKQIARELRKHHCYPVHLTQKQLNEYYNGYSNSVLWPLLHDLAVVSGNTPKNWKAYKEVNDLFADETIALSEPGSTVWVHDYQLLLVPERLKQERPTDHIGFFLHIPFPGGTVFNNLPHGADLLRGILGADLVGLHTNGYVEQFLESCRALQIGIVEDKKVTLPTRVIRVTNFPISIDYAKFSKASKLTAVRRERRRLGWKYRGRKVIVTVDRLDPTKGLVERLKAYQKLLKANPQLWNKVVLVMLAVPSRSEIDEYKTLKINVEKLVAAINTKYGTRRWQPVDYLYESWPFERVAALYQRADVAFIAPIRDGMNLVAKEYLASRPKHDGVLILSETAGAAEELKDAILVNPAKPATLVAGLQRALSMPRKELRTRTRTMQRHIEKFTIQNWADTFVDALQLPSTANTPVSITKTLTARRSTTLLKSYSASGKRLFLLDYDGVLRSFETDPSKAKPTAEVIRLIKRLANNPLNDIVIISGRSKHDLQNWFGQLPIALAAEHGALFRRLGGKTWHKTDKLQTGWQKEITSVLSYYASITPGSFVEEKEWSIVWHYRTASNYYAHKHLVAIKRLIKPMLKKYDLTAKDGKKVFEIHPDSVSKGRVMQEWLIHDYDFVLCIGDDATDEEMFADLPPTAYSVKVGRGQTLARYRVPGVPEVIRLLQKL